MSEMVIEDFYWEQDELGYTAFLRVDGVNACGIGSTVEEAEKNAWRQLEDGLGSTVEEAEEDEERTTDVSE